MWPELAAQTHPCRRRLLSLSGRNDWAPGLNGAIPLTPKKDPVHGITFMIHDLMHQAIPDLIFTGVPKAEDQALWRNVYSVWRMMSEAFAFALALADMIFVDSRVQSKLDYDRRTWVGAHPLFDPCYVACDAKGAKPAPLAEVARSCFVKASD
jgi:hypothetical protein